MASQAVLADECCPNCGSENLAYRVDGKLPPFCMGCRFPLLPLAGKYRLLRELSQGGCGTVYEAIHVELTRDPKRAIKVIKPEIMKRDGMMHRFRREVQVTGSLSQTNQHIVRIYDDFGEVPGLGTFYVMEFLEGASVEELLKSRGTGLPFEQVSHLFLQLCDAMQDAHAEGIVHRDLKPENLFVVPRRRDPHFLKVIDFGIARPFDDDQEAKKLTGGMLGTPLYMSPEQCSNRPVDARTDIYAMGCILFEMCAGFPPFSSQTMGGKEPSVVELFTFHLVQPAPTLSAFLPEDSDVPLEVSKVIEKAMAKEPDERFSTIEECEQAFLAATRVSESTVTRASAFLPRLAGQDALAMPDVAPLLPPPPGDMLLPKAHEPGVALPEAGAAPKEKADLSAIDDALDAIPARSSGAGKWLLLLVLLGGVGAGGWWWQSQQHDSSASAPYEPIVLHNRPKRPFPVRHRRVTRRISVPRRPQVIPVRRVGGRKLAVRHHRRMRPVRHHRLVRHRRRRRRRLAYRRRTHVVRRRAPVMRRTAAKGRVVSVCPSIEGMYWVILFAPRHMRGVKLRWSSGSGRVVAKSWGFCIGAASRRARLVISAPNRYHACKSSIWGRRKRSYRLHMLSESEPAPHPTRITSYCFK